jgi:hypothetical protein
MSRLLTVLAIVCAASSGCGSWGAPPGRAVVGRWDVVAINGKPLPDGSSISVEYRPDGRLIVESTGVDVPALDEGRLKAVLDRLNAPGTFLTLKVSVEGHEIEMRRKPGTIPIPSG